MHDMYEFIEKEGYQSYSQEKEQTNILFKIKHAANAKGTWMFVLFIAGLLPLIPS